MANKAEVQAPKFDFKSALQSKVLDTKDSFVFQNEDLLQIPGSGYDEESGKYILEGTVLQGQRGRVVSLPCLMNGKKATGVFHASQIRHLLQAIVNGESINGVSLTETDCTVRANKMIQRTNGQQVVNGSFGVYSLTPLESKNLVSESSVSAISFAEED